MQTQVSTRLIPLSQGLWALVDATDYEALRQYTWSAVRQDKNLYAVTGAVREVHPQWSMHRLLLGFPAEGVDHINRDSLDNRRCNLRPASKSQNGCNYGLPAHNTSGFRGVTWDQARGKWSAQVRLNQRTYHIGRFADPVEAAYARDAAALRLHGKFAWLNFP
jgi:HNH endonuclease